ncbi:MAG: helicase-related protein, partial [Nitrosomonas ureae]
AIRSGVEILVATPGRLLDHLQQKNLILSKIEILILDEADRMLDMGFLPDIKQIIQMLPDQRQNLMFSATFSGEIKKLAGKILKNPILIEVAKQNSVSDLISHVVYSVESKNKQEFLIDMIKKKNLQQVLIFTRTKHGADHLAQKLNNREILSSAIHGDRNQLQRTQALDNFKCGLTRVLVATDVAARGLDIEELTHVINFELPNNPEDYVHRIGRTGRAGAKGFAISFVSREETILLGGIERLLGIKIQVEESNFGLKNQQAELPNKTKTIEEQKKSRAFSLKREPISKRPRRIEKIEDPLFSQPYVSKYPDLLSIQVGTGKSNKQIIHKQYPSKTLPALFIPPVTGKQK